MEEAPQLEALLLKVLISVGALQLEELWVEQVLEEALQLEALLLKALTSVGALQLGEL